MMVRVHEHSPHYTEYSVQWRLSRYICKQIFQFFEIRFSHRTWNFNLPKYPWELDKVAHGLTVELLRQLRPKISAQYGHG